MATKEVFDAFWHNVPPEAKAEIEKRIASFNDKTQVRKNALIYQSERTTYFDLETFVDGLTAEERRDLARHYEQKAERAARLTVYLDERYGAGCGDQGHRKAVKRQNAVARQLRRSFGYYITPDLKI